MGQMTVGILYGIEVPDLPDDEGGEAPHNLVLRWETAKKIDPFRPGPKIRVEREGGTVLLGVWVAVGGSGQDNAPHFLDKCLLLAEVPHAYAARITRASKLWHRFAAWVEKREGLKLPLPKLWLTPCETP